MDADDKYSAITTAMMLCSKKFTRPIGNGRWLFGYTNALIDLPADAITAASRYIVKHKNTFPTPDEFREVVNIWQVASANKARADCESDEEIWIPMLEEYSFNMRWQWIFSYIVEVEKLYARVAPAIFNRKVAWANALALRWMDEDPDAKGEMWDRLRTAMRLSAEVKKWPNSTATH